MGGRGGSSGIVAGGVSYASKDHTLINEEAREVMWIAGTNHGDIVQAETDEHGNLMLSNMPAKEYYPWSKRKTYAITTLKHGITNMNEKRKIHWITKRWNKLGQSEICIRKNIYT